MESTADADDSVLLTRLRSGDQTALESLVRMHYDGLISFLTHLLGSHDAAEDVLQDLWLRLWQRRESLDVRGSFRVYLFRGARNIAIDTLRRQQLEQRVNHHLIDAGIFSSNGDDLASVFERDELAMAITNAIKNLPPRCREIFVLSRDGGLSYREIAEILGVSTNTVNTQITRAGAAIRRAVLPFIGVLVTLHL